VRAQAPGRDDGNVTPTSFVRSATQLATVPFVPEICMYQVDDLYALWEQTERHLRRAGLSPPFWGAAWPGGQALARYVLDHTALVAGRTVIDFGSGSGLVAIAAAKAGAARVIACETDPLGRAAIGLNAAANGVPRPVCMADIRAAGPGPEVVLAGDVWYDRELASQVSDYLDAASAAGAVVLTGDIGRRYFPRGRYRCLASYEVPASIALEGRHAVSASVWQANPDRGTGQGVPAVRQGNEAVQDGSPVLTFPSAG
jgi:predicted nicotinamide N-methyase